MRLDGNDGGKRGVLFWGWGCTTRQLGDKHGEHCQAVDFVALRAQSPLTRLNKHGHGGGVMYYLLYMHKLYNT
jgi:hypothetical protein